MKRRCHIIVFALIFFFTAPGLLFAQNSLDDITTRETVDGRLRFHYPAEFKGKVDALKESGPALVSTLQHELALETMPTVDVWVLRHVADYYTLHGRPNAAPEWAAGLSLRNKSTIILVNGTGKSGQLIDIDATFRHELAHVAIDVASGGRGVPRWFNEGFAIMHADEWTADRSDMLSRSAAANALTPFSALETYFPAHHNSASLAYAQSFHFVRDLKTRHRDDIYARVLKRIRADDVTFSKAFKLETGESVPLAEARWRQDLVNASSIWAILMDGMLLFFGASILFLVAWWVRRNRSAKKLASMDEDAPVSGWDYDESQYPLPGDSSR